MSTLLIPTYEELTVLAQEVGTQLLAAQMSCATAESCTGGLVGHLLTEIAGSSTYFMGGEPLLTRMRPKRRF